MTFEGWGFYAKRGGDATLSSGSVGKEGCYRISARRAATFLY